MMRVEQIVGTAIVWWVGVLASAVVLAALTWIVAIIWDEILKFAMRRYGGPNLLKQMRWTHRAWVMWAAEVARTQDLEKWPRGVRDLGWEHASDLRKFFAEYDPENERNWKPAVAPAPEAP